MADTKVFQEEDRRRTVSFLQLFSFADKYDCFLMFFGSLGSIIHGAALPIMFLFFGKLLNALGGKNIEQTTHVVNQNAENFVWVGLAALVSSWMEVSFWMYTGERQAAKLRAEYLKAILRQDIAQFDADGTTGAIVNSFAVDTLLVQDAIGEKVGNFLHYLATFAVGFVVGFVDQWRIAGVTLAVLPLTALAGGAMVYSLAITGDAAENGGAAGGSEAATISEQAISQVRTVYSFVSEGIVMRSYSDALHKTMKMAAGQGLVKGLGLGITNCVAFASYALLLWYGSLLITRGEASGSVVIATTFAVTIGSVALGQAMPNVNAFLKGKKAFAKIMQTINQQQKTENVPGGGDVLDVVEGRIELRNVDFSYPTRPEVKVFEKFSLIIPAGETVAIVGVSGAGKSTVISLIERFYDPNAGEILLDGHEIQSLNLKWLREQIGLVNQEPMLFATTIAANILYGNSNATMEEIILAAQAANVHSFIEKLPLGYETQVGDKGVQISGGQKQRVAIARAMLKNPKILLLDEATSALDTDSEMVVQEALDRLMVGRTTVVVAHRLSTIRNAGTIAVVSQGQVVESGTHQELTSKDGSFTALVRFQEMIATNDRAKGASLSLRSPQIFHTSEMDLGTIDSQSMNEGESTRGSFIRLIQLSRNYWEYGLGGTIASIGAGCLLPAFAIILGEVLELYYFADKHHMRKEVSKYALYLVGLAVVTPIAYALQYFCLAMLGEKLVRRVREMMFTTILRNELGWFDEDENNGSQLTARLTSDATVVKAAIGDKISIIVQNSTMMILSIVFSFILSWKMAAVMMAAFPVTAAAVFIEKVFLTGFAGDQAKAYARSTQIAGEAVSNIRTVAAFNAQEKVQLLFKSELAGPARKSFWKGQIAGAGFGISQCFMIFMNGMALWFAGVLVKKREETFGTVMKIFIILVVAAFAAAESFSMMPDVVKGGTAVKSIFKVLNRVTRIEPDDREGVKVEKIWGDITFRNVKFAYPSRPNVPVLKNLNLSIRSGHSLALVGASGSGKTSIIALIERFYDPSSGQILVDGMDIKTYNLRSLRQHIALVQQEPALFATTIYENIIYGKASASEVEVIEAAKTANAHSFISSLPDAYQTRVGERGVQLSGGQKQRVAIARAILKDPAIFLMDEATSALDSQSEKVVQKALARLLKGKTTVIIAHNLSTIQGADTIVVVEDGTIVEEGSHAELLAKGGGYSYLVELIKTQSVENRADDDDQSSALINGSQLSFRDEDGSIKAL
ncbi:unnamed protein product [Calypogeia fissa]